MNRFLSACALGACLLLIGASVLPLEVAHAVNQSGASPRLSNMDRAQLLAYHDKLTHDLDTKAYQHLKDSDRATIAASQTQIRTLLAKVSSLKDLSEDQKLVLFNEEEKITLVLESHEQDRLVCERVLPTGSHRPVLQCMTVAQREQARKDTQKAMIDRQQVPQDRPSN